MQLLKAGLRAGIYLGPSWYVILCHSCKRFFTGVDAEIFKEVVLHRESVKNYICIILFLKIVSKGVC